MHFIEELFGLSPDGGNGLTEVTIFLAVLAVILLAVLGVAARRRPSKSVD